MSATDKSPKIAVSLLLVAITATIIFALSVIGLLSYASAARQISAIPADLDIDWSGFILAIVFLVIQAAVAVYAIFVILRRRVQSSFNAACIFIAAMLCGMVARLFMNPGGYGVSTSFGGYVLAAIYVIWLVSLLAVMLPQTSLWNPAFWRRWRDSVRR